LSPRDNRWYHVINTLIRHPDGTLSKLAVIQDITERKQAEKALQEAEAKYRSIFENAVEGIFQSTPEGRLLIVNPALARMHGYDSPEDMLTGIMDLGTRSSWIRSNGMNLSAKSKSQGSSGARNIKYIARTALPSGYRWTPGPCLKKMAPLAT